MAVAPMINKKRGCHKIGKGITPEKLTSHNVGIDNLTIAVRLRCVSMPAMICQYQSFLPQGDF